MTGFDRIRLVGDENCGVSLECLDCWDGGRPPAYLDDSGGDPCRDDPLVTTVTTAADLLAAGRKHLNERH